MSYFANDSTAGVYMILRALNLAETAGPSAEAGARLCRHEPGHRHLRPAAGPAGASLQPPGAGRR
ncbi:hypothetical protein HC928_17800 [bacterium]|nr:hypothetical protein [bacterium]